MVLILRVSGPNQKYSVPFWRTGLLVLIWATLQMVAFPKELYVSPSGSDTNSGSIEFPFAKIQTGVNKLQPGDTLFVREGTYRERVSFPRSGTPKQRIFVRGFPGEKAVITGLEPVGPWVLWDSTNNIWKTPMKWTLGIGRNQVFANGRVMIEARFPNAPTPGLEIPVNGLSPLWPTFGPFSVPIGSSTNQPGLILSELLRNQPPDYWKGGVYFGVHWAGGVAQTGIIESSKDGELHVGKRTQQWWATGDTYYDREFGRGMIFGHIHALDQPGEWQWQDDTLYFIPPDAKSLVSVEAKSRQLALDLSGKSYITISGIEVLAASARMKDCVECALENCQFEYLSHFMRNAYLDRPEESRDIISAGEAGIYISGRDNGVIGCRLHVSAGAGVQIRGYHHIIHNCLIDEIDYSGQYLNAVSDGVTDHESEHLLIGGHVVTFNTMSNAGRHFFNFHGNGSSEYSWNRAPADYMASLVAYNHMYNGLLFTRDAGFITGFFDSGGTLNGLRSQVAYNVMHDDFDLEALRVPLSSIIYLDNGTEDVDIHHNLIFASPGTVQKPFFFNSGCSHIGVTNNVFHGRFRTPVELLEAGDFPDGVIFPYGHDFSRKPVIPRWPPIQSKVVQVETLLRDGREVKVQPLTIAGGDILNLGAVDFTEGWNTLLLDFASDTPGITKAPILPKGPRHHLTDEHIVLNSIEKDAWFKSKNPPDGKQFAKMESGGWLRFDNVRLGEGYKRIRAVFSSTNRSPSHLEVRLDSPTGPLIAKVKLYQTHATQKDGVWMFDEATSEIDPSAQQTHGLFVVAESEDKRLVGMVEYLRLEGYRGTSTLTNNEPRIEVRIDRPDGPLIGLLFARFTGGSKQFVTLVTQLESPTGVHPTYLVAKYPRKGSIGVIDNVRLERAHNADAWQTTLYREPAEAESQRTETLSARLQSRPRAHLVDVGELHPQPRPPLIVSDQPNRPVIDGLVSEWKFPPLLLSETLEGIKMDEGAAKVWLSSDGQALYIAAEAPISAEVYGIRPFGSVWKNTDWMEVVLESTSNTNQSVIHGFRGRIDGTFSMMNPDNLDAERTDKVVPGLEYKANRKSGSWSAEWRIPLSALGLSGVPGNRMKCNVSMVSHSAEASRTWVSRWGSPYDLDHNGGDLVFGSGDAVLPTALKGRFLAWFDASDSSTLERSASGAVTRWQDRSRRNHFASQAKPEHQPRFIAEGLNGKPTLAFGAVPGTYLDLPSLSETNQNAIAFVVFSNPNPVSKTTPYQRLFTTSDGTKYDYKVGVAACVNGVETGGPRLVSVEAGNAALRQPRIGSMSPNLGTFFDGFISEIIVIGGDVSAEQKLLIEAYLRKKWNLKE